MAGLNLGRIWRRTRRLVAARSEPALLLALHQQLQAAHAAAEAAARAVSGDGTAGGARPELDAIEHAGDEARGRFVEALSRALVTPLDREDLFRLSRSIDDVVDNLRDFVREWDLYGATPEPGLAVLLEEVAGVIRILDSAVDGLGDRGTDLAGAALAARKAGNQVRYRYQEEMAKVMQGDLDMAVIRSRELLRRLDVLGTRLGEAADVLADAAVKRTLL